MFIKFPTTKEKSVVSEEEQILRSQFWLIHAPVWETHIHSFETILKTHSKSKSEMKYMLKSYSTIPQKQQIFHSKTVFHSPSQKAFIRIYGLKHAKGAEDTRINKPHSLISHSGEARHIYKLNNPVTQTLLRGRWLIYLGMPRECL